MKRIIIDTNFLMLPSKFRLDIFSEFSRICDFSYRLCIYEKSIDELKKIIDGQRGKDKKAAQFALKLIKLKNISIINPEQKDECLLSVDELMLNSISHNTIIATQDFRLRKELLKRGAAVIMSRQKKYLQLLERKLYK